MKQLFPPYMGFVAIVCGIVFFIFWGSIILGVNCIVNNDGANAVPATSEWK